MILVKSSKNIKKTIYVLPLLLFIASILLLANGEDKNKISKNSVQKHPSAERKTALKKWEATADGIMYKEWEASPAGKKVYASEAKIRKSISNYTNMEGVVASLSLPAGSRLGFGVMVKIKGDDFILSFGPEKSNDNEFQQLHTLKVNDKIIIKSHSVMHAPKYSYPILSGDYVERDNKIVYKRSLSKGGC